MSDSVSDLVSESVSESVQHQHTNQSPIQRTNEVPRGQLLIMMCLDMHVCYACVLCMCVMCL